MCSDQKSMQSMIDEPQECPSQAEIKLLIERAELMSQDYFFSGLKYLAERSKEELAKLAEYSRPHMSDEEREEIAYQMRAGGGAAAAPALASQMRSGGGAAAAPALASQMRSGGGAASAPSRRRQSNSDGEDDYIRRYSS